MMKNATKSDPKIFTIIVTASFVNNNSLAGCSATTNLIVTANLTYDKCYDRVIRESDWVSQKNFTLYDLSVSVTSANST